MKKKTQPVLLLLLLFVTIVAHAHYKTIDSTATITIHAKDYKNNIIFFNFSSKIRPSIILDSNGIGTTIIPIKDFSFVSFQTNDSVFFNLIMAPGYQINYSIDEGITRINGIGSEPNNYLLRAHILLNNFSNVTKDLREKGKVIEFVTLVNDFETKFKNFDKHFKDSISLSQKISYIVKNSIEATVLLEKQSFLLGIDEKIEDSLNLENRLGLKTNDLFSDTILFKTQFVDFLNFLILNFDQTIGFKLYGKYPESNVYPIVLFSEINKNAKYSERIKEFLLYYNIATELSEIGTNPTIENLCEVFYKIYPSSNYNVPLRNLFLKFNALTLGNLAPQFSGKTQTGKTISLNDFKGKVLLIDVWATWCGPCKVELPYSHKIQEVFEKNKDFSLLYLSIDSDASKWKTYLEKNKWLSGLHINIDDKKFKDSYKITGIPRYILIDKKGLIINAFCDKPSKGTIEDEIRKAL